MKLEVALPLALFLGSVSAQSTAAPWGQCGGSTVYTTSICPAGQVCTYLNEFFSQCLPISSSSTSLAPSTSAPPVTTAKSSSKTSSTLKTTTKKSTTISTTKKTTTSSTTTTKTAATPTITWVALYGQCGGSLAYQWQNVQCAPPGVCVYENQFFSNCFPPSSSSDTAAPATSTAA